MAKLSLGQSALLFRRVGLGLRAGIDVIRIWTSEGERGVAASRPHFMALRDRLVKGDTLHEAMVACRGYFPDFACEMVDVGEKTGRLDEVCLRLADHYDHLLQLRRGFLAKIAWPIMQLIAAIFVIAALIWILGVLPEAGDMLGFGLRGTPGVMIYFAIIGAIIFAGYLVYLAFSNDWFGEAPVRFAMKIPWIGDCLHTMALQRLTWSLAMSLNAGIDAKRSITIALRSTHNPLYRKQIDSVARSITRGNEFHESLRATGIFPHDFLTALEAAELSGTAVDSLQHLSEQYDERVKVLTNTFAMALSFVVWGGVVLILVTMIGRLIMNVIMPVHNLQNDVLRELHLR